MDTKVETSNNIPELEHLPTAIKNWIVDNCNKMTAVWSDEGSLLYISSSIKWLLGFKASEVYGMKWYDHVASDDVSYIEDYFNSKKKSIQLFNIHVINAFKEKVWFECSIERVNDEHTQKTYFISSLENNANSMQTREMMVRSEKMSTVGQLASGIAHEIRNPLTSLKGFIQLLQSGIKEKEVYYNIMIDEIDKIESITSELLFLAKPMTDKKKSHPIKPMVQEIITLLQPQANLDNITLTASDLDDESIYCDRTQIKQVLINLIKNAMESMKGPGKIKVITHTNESNLKIDIIDEGSGVPSDIMHKISEPFFTTKTTGTGLGLMITKQILDQHDAKIKIIQNKTIGSTFRIILPKHSSGNS